MRARAVGLGCLVAGLVDVTTGVLLVSVPGRTLQLMMVPEVVAPAVFMRFIGAFVAGVGLLYVVAWRWPGGGRRAHLMEATALVRAVVALFVGTAIAAGALSLPWLSVTCTDAALAAAQLALLRRGLFREPA